MTSPPIPVSVVGGYLGAGKTTLINRVLTGDHGRRIGVIVNDFGDVAIDEALIDPTAGPVRALANGCVCCSAVDGLATALNEIAMLDPPVEHLIIEVSGVGDPWAVAQWGRTPGYALDGVIVVADPSEIGAWMEDRYVGDVVRAQLAAADLVVLSRTDVVDEATRDAARVAVGRHSTAPCLFGPDLALELLVGPTTHAVAPERPHRTHASLTIWAGVHGRAEIDSWLRAAPDGVVRVKGFIDTGEGIVLAQRMGRRTEVTPVHAPAATAVTVIASTSPLPAAVAGWAAAMG